MAGFNLGGAGSGALTGAGIGSAFTPVGTAVGGLLGGLFGGFGSGGGQGRSQSAFDKKQQQLYGQAHEGLQGSGPFADLYNFNPEMMMDYYQKGLVNPAMQQFEQSMAPKIMGQFRGGNLGNSSYAGQALARAGTDVQRDLDAQLAKLLYQGQESALNRRVNAVDKLLGLNSQEYRPSSGDPMMEIFKMFGPKALDLLARNYGPQGGAPNVPASQSISQGNVPY